MPHAPGRVTVAAVGEDKADALGKAALIAERIANDPIMSALMPPQARAAIVVAKGLAASAKRGSKYVKHFWRKLRGPGKKRLAKVLHSEAAAKEQAEVAGIRSLVKKAVKYGTPQGWAYMAGKKALKKIRKRKAKGGRARARAERAQQEAPEQPEQEAPEQDSPDMESQDYGGGDNGEQYDEGEE